MKKIVSTVYFLTLFYFLIIRPEIKSNKSFIVIFLDWMPMIFLFLFFFIFQYQFLKILKNKDFNLSFPKNFNEALPQKTVYFILKYLLCFVIGSFGFFIIGQELSHWLKTLL